METSGAFSVIATESNTVVGNQILFGGTPEFIPFPETGAGTRFEGAPAVPPRLSPIRAAFGWR